MKISCQKIRFCNAMVEFSLPAGSIFFVWKTIRIEYQECEDVFVKPPLIMFYVFEIYI